MEFTVQQIIDSNNEINKNNCHGFYDWFCRDSSLKGKAQALLPKLKFLAKHLDISDLKVSFKNNCPFHGSLYDDIRISSDDGQVYIYVCPRSGHSSDKGIATFGFKNNSASITFRTEDYKNWSELKKHIKENSSEINNQITL